MPFMRLPHLDCTITENLSRVTSPEQDGRKPSIISKFEGSNSSVQGAYDGPNMKTEDLNIDEWILATRIHLDKVLGDALGVSSDLLRRDRFMNWFVDGDTWRSDCQEQFIQDLTSNPERILELHPQLRIVFRRHYLLIQLYHELPIRTEGHDNKPTDLGQHTPHMTWSSEAWLMKYANGIPPLSSLLVRSRIKSGKVYDAYTKVHLSLDRF
ncbi:hypothetical protein N7492_009188 [Penicillium capsulatum]|uniref:Uncharacterized protein n=1 Tax=Penicillium capsulatum TaxID=69766 RepID=A0A9W9LI07_9EURO|nr:hypothetical protein N7492_009188 [Penicillium capsulatum]KAJ6106584.1 hypothetical protein N7512_010101 [Penicillium capsulatum]